MAATYEQTGILNDGRTYHIVVTMPSSVRTPNIRTANAPNSLFRDKSVFTARVARRVASFLSRKLVNLLYELWRLTC